MQNYIFPIRFSYKGWDVILNKKLSFFSTLTVEAIFTPPNLRGSIVAEQEIIKFAYENPKVLSRTLFGVPPLESISYAEYKKYLDVSNNFISTRTKKVSSRVERFSATNLMDNFIGSNTHATKKLMEKVERYMDANLPNISNHIDKRDYRNFLKQSGICPTILEMAGK